MSLDLYVAARLELADVEQGFEAMRRRSYALGPAFRELKRPLRLDQRDHSKKREGPSGMWAPRAASTMARMRAGGRRARKPLGRLTGAVTYASDATGVMGRSKALWSGAHQDGAVVGRGSRLPARPFLWLSNDILRIAENALGTALVEAFGGR